MLFIILLVTSIVSAFDVRRVRRQDTLPANPFASLPTNSGASGLSPVDTTGTAPSGSIDGSPAGSSGGSPAGNTDSSGLPWDPYRRNPDLHAPYDYDVNNGVFPSLPDGPIYLESVADGRFPPIPGNREFPDLPGVPLYRDTSFLTQEFPYVTGKRPGTGNFQSGLRPLPNPPGGPDELDEFAEALKFPEGRRPIEGGDFAGFNPRQLKVRRTRLPTRRSIQA